MEEKKNFSYHADIKLSASKLIEESDNECEGEYRILEMNPLTPFYCRWQHKSENDTITNNEGLFFVDYYHGTVHEFKPSKLNKYLEKALSDVIANKKAAAIDKSLILGENTVETMINSKKNIESNQGKPLHMMPADMQALLKKK